MWVTDCVDEVLETTLPPKTAFVVGWPITNCVASFATPEEKSLWHGLLSKYVWWSLLIRHTGMIACVVCYCVETPNESATWTYGLAYV